jgi:hypothetical protein
MTAAIAPSTFLVPKPPHVESLSLLNLLIVDDERAVREACREAAGALGYRTSASESAEQALRLIESQNIDVMLLDLKLPGTGGLEVLRKLSAGGPISKSCGHRPRNGGIGRAGNEGRCLRLCHEAFQPRGTKASAGTRGRPPQAED